MPTTIQTWRKSPLQFLEKLKGSDESKTLIGQAIIALLKSDHSNYDGSSSRKLAVKVISGSDNIEINLYAIFLIIWSSTADAGKNLTEAEMIIKKLRQLDYSKLYPETEATVYSAIGFHKASEGNKAARDKYLKMALKVKNLNAPHKELILNNFASFLGSKGELADIQNKLTPTTDKASNAFRKICHISNMIQVCQADQSAKLLVKLKEDYAGNSLLNKYAQQILRLTLDTEFLLKPSSMVFFGNDFGNREIDDYQKNNYSCHSLLTKDPVNGLTWARKLTDENPISMTHNNLSSFALIRAELANGHHEASHSLLQAKEAMGYPHYLDDFFYARIALLKSEIALACDHLKKLHKSCQHYGAYQRLDFEIEMSCELNAKELLFIHKQKKSTYFSKKLIETKSIYEPQFQQESIIVGHSKEILVIKKEISKLAKNKSSVLITGETGVGKEVIANAIHQSSKNKNLPYLPINCGAISESLLQSELFGHVAGAFTGALKYQPGIFEAAKKGTVFLDEIGDVTPAIQIALLRVLENKEVRPIGSTQIKKIHCKIIAATNKNLEEEIQQGSFREDLYYRLNQLSIVIPPLRKRKEDIVTLASHFLSHQRADRNIPVMSDELQIALQDYTWPGNVRQLKNEMEKMVLLNSGKLFYDLSDCPLLLVKSDTSVKKLRSKNDLPAISLVRNRKSPHRRKENILTLFSTSSILTRGEVIKSLGYAPGTVAKDLAELVTEGYIKRIEPNSSARTHYFEMIEEI